MDAIFFRRMKTHPEQRPDEIYLGNTRPEDLWKSSWRTSRLGENPLMVDGTPYTGGNLNPWFIKKSEVQAQIDSEKLNNKLWSEERIKTFEQMISETTISGG